MSSIPEKQIEWLYDRVRETGEPFKIKNWKLTVDFEVMPTGWTGEIWSLYHYDTLVLVVEDGKPCLSSGAYSVSDRDGINSLLILMGLSNSWKASIINGNIQIMKI